MRNKKQMEDFFKDSSVSYDLMHEKGKELEALNNLLDDKLNRWMELEELRISHKKSPPNGRAFKFI